MQLRKAGFGSNGHGDLRGTLIAYSDNGEPLGVEHTGNYSREGGKALLRKLAAVGIDDEVARVAIQRKLIEIRSGVDEALSAGAPRRERELPSVMVSNRPMREIADESWELLYDSEGATRFFRFGDTLSLVDTGVKPLKPRSVNVPALRHYLDRLADYQAIGKEEQMYAARPPKDILESMLAVVPPRLPPLMGVVHAPFVSPQGEVVTQEGYHNETGLYLSLGGLTLPPVPLRPTGGDVEAARDLLLDELLGDFPFQSDADKAHALAAILTPLARPLIEGPTPLFCIEAPLAGTGKSLLADVVAHIATGSPAHPMVEGGDDAEWRKRITSVLMDTPTVVLIDNLRRRLDSSALSAVVTARYWQDRPMGVSRNVTLPVRCTWLLTGNNPIFSIEIARRILGADKRQRGEAVGAAGLPASPAGPVGVAGAAPAAVGGADTREGVAHRREAPGGGGDGVIRGLGEGHRGHSAGGGGGGAAPEPGGGVSGGGDGGGAVAGAVAAVVAGLWRGAHIGGAGIGHGHRAQAADGPAVWPYRVWGQDGAGDGAFGDAGSRGGGRVRAGGGDSGGSGVAHVAAGEGGGGEGAGGRAHAGVSRAGGGGGPVGGAGRGQNGMMRSHGNGRLNWEKAPQGQQPPIATLSVTLWTLWSLCLIYALI